MSASLLKKMGVIRSRSVLFTVVLVLVFVASIAVTSQAATTIVGGSEHWRYGFNYTDWALRNASFYLNDVLVFKYDPPTNTTFPHSVSLLRDRKSFLACDFKRSKLVGNILQGGGEGFKFVLNKRRPYYFACGERNGLHCTAGMMKFSVKPTCYG